MAGHSKRKKFHDKDKYYRLAKEQGLRSRAAFKLTQINQKFPLLEKCQTGVLDLCAAPGGWTQIAARTCPKHVPVVAVDILPIRALPGNNVTTLVGDITTDKCKSEITKALQKALNKNANASEVNMVDVVLHDGAPNVGAEYGKDAYQQNELALHALKCATQHLKAGGAFLTKVYRSRDYAALQWVLQQLFGSVQALKPAASRLQSAEIFLICQDYKAPAKLDPRLLDPKAVFEHVEGDTSGASGGGGSNALSIFSKQWDKPRRQRGGYDLEHLDATMRHIESIQHFVSVSSLQAAIQILSTSTGLSFSCQHCQPAAKAAGSNNSDDDDDGPARCQCKFLLHHPLTTPEIKECVSDLQLLNKSDFKGLLSWRTKMQDAVRAQRVAARDDDDDQSDQDGADDDDADSELDSEQEDEEILQEIGEMRQRRQRERKRLLKKQRAVASKRRRQAALGMDLNAIDVPEHDKIFSLATITTKGQLDAAAQVNLDHVTDEQIFGNQDDDDDDHVIVGGAPVDDEDDKELDEEERQRRRERDLEEGYAQYLENTKNGLAKSGTKMAKRSKKLQRQQLLTEAAEDQEMAAVGTEHMDYNARTYAQMLTRGGGGADDSDSDEDSSSEDDDDDDDGFHSAPLTPEEHAQKMRAKRPKRKKDIDDDDDDATKNPLIHSFPEEPASAKTARWFSNPLFAKIGEAAQHSMKNDDESREDAKDSSSDEDSNNRKKKSKKKSGLTAEEVLASMPKTDKQKRHEKRLKAMAREERRKARQAKQLDKAQGEFELAPANNDGGDDDMQDDELAHLSEDQRKKVLKARELIKAGMGSMADDGKHSSGIEIVPAQDARPLPVLDTRKYDSDNEDYDSDDYARTLALGTMMLRRSKEKALVDSSYNRYAWNDPEDLPEWFVDDEAKHYRPQLPIPPALIAKMKEKMLVLSAKPIKKVAEARARKSKRAKLKLAAAKKKAEAVADSSEMSEAMKLRAISKALRGQESKKPGKSYVVAKKGVNSAKGGKGVKVVDKRMKADKRALTRIEKKRKKGKQNKLVGSKRRRQHS